jgi:hypothetical protein
MIVARPPPGRGRPRPPRGRPCRPTGRPRSELVESAPPGGGPPRRRVLLATHQLGRDDLDAVQVEQHRPRRPTVVTTWGLSWWTSEIRKMCEAPGAVLGAVASQGQCKQLEAGSWMRLGGGDSFVGHLLGWWMQELAAHVPQQPQHLGAHGQSTPARPWDRGPQPGCLDVPVRQAADPPRDHQRLQRVGPGYPRTEQPRTKRLVGAAQLRPLQFHRPIVVLTVIGGWWPLRLSGRSASPRRWYLARPKNSSTSASNAVWSINRTLRRATSQRSTPSHGRN